jgi:MinD-like ATPase involved in chromosome partitioning or flagellar assembly
MCTLDILLIFSILMRKPSKMTITLLAKKGGVGKSTVSILLHEAFKKAGKSVAIQDWDAQGTSNKALGYIDGKRADTAEAYDVLIFDTPPNLEHPATAAAVRSANVALVITSPSPADIWEAEEAVKFVQSKGPQATVRVLFNKVKKNTILGRLLDESAKQVGAPALPIHLSARECYQHAIGQGWGALDAAAREEVLQLAVSLLSLGD